MERSGADEEMAEQQRRREEEAFRKAVRQPAEKRKQEQEQARIACYPYEQALHQCYETKWFPMITCYEENNAFWDCFKEKRGFLKSKLDLWQEQRLDKTAASPQQPPPRNNQ